MQANLFSHKIHDDHWGPAFHLLTRSSLSVRFLRKKYIVHCAYTHVKIAWPCARMMRCTADKIITKRSLSSVHPRFPTRLVKITNKIPFVDMRKWVSSLWENYKYRFVPWIILNLKQRKKEPTTKINCNQNSIKPGTTINTPEVIKVGTNDKLQSGSSPMIVDHVTKGHDQLVSDQIIRDLLVKFFDRLLECHKGEHDYLSKKGQEIMHQVFGYSVERRKSQVCEGTGVFLASGQAKSGDLIALYPGTLYLPSEPLFFPSLGNPFIFRCSDNLHIDGNDKLLSKSIYKSCCARDRFQIDLPCCDLTWLTSQPLSPINIGQYVNNRSKSQENNVVYQESELSLGGKEPSNFPVHLCRYLPNVWSNPQNNRYPLRLVPLIAVKEINAGDEIISSYFTFVHVQNEKMDK